MSERNTFLLDTILKKRLRSRTKKQLRFEHLPEFDAKKHERIGVLPARMKRLFAVILYLSDRIKRDNTSQHQLFLYEHERTVAEHTFLVEVTKIFPKQGRVGALGLCRGGILVRVLGNSKVGT